MPHKIDNVGSNKLPSKGYIAFDQVDYRNKWVYFTVSFIVFVYVWSNRIHLYNFGVNELNGYGATEFLINYEGGFVRRGLLGQLLYWFYGFSGFPVENMIRIICGFSYLFVVYFFLKNFIKQGYSWWFIFSPLVVGYVFLIIRKDFLEMTVLIGMLSLLKNQSPSILKRLLATALAILGIFFHEPFFFWGVPIFLLLLLGGGKSSKQRWGNSIFALAVFAAFIPQLIYKGDTPTANAIVEAWNNQFGEPVLGNSSYNSIGALTWNLKETLQSHFHLNTYGAYSMPYGLFWQPLWGIAIYYFCTNFIFVFHRPGMKNVQERKLAFSSVYLLTLICMLPMFTILSTDFSRSYCYVSVTALATLVIFPANYIIKLFPHFYLRMVERINNFLVRYFPPSRPIMVFLLLFLAQFYSSFTIQGNIENSIAWYFFDWILRHIMPLL